MAFQCDGTKVVLALVLIFGTCASLGTSRKVADATMVKRHEQWMHQHGRVYKDDAEKAMRFKIFKKNVEFIESFNNANTKPYKLGANSFADMTNEEFRASQNGYKMSSHSKSPKTTPFRYENATELPSRMDWRKKGAVTGVKDQGYCGCCWAFSAVAAMEGINKLKTGKLISLSEQELVDCDISEDEGCNGGMMDNAFKFIVDNHGLTTESKYPYKGKDGMCKKKASSAAKITGYEDVPANAESALLKAVAHQPVSVAVDASSAEFSYYMGGVFTGECGIDLNHGVTAVGYGETSDGTKYWLVKNSWGRNWGEEGYIRMKRDVDAKEGLCGIAMQASYPTA